MSISPFDKVMSSKTEAELRTIIDDIDGYRIEAREAAVRKLERLTGQVSKESEEIETLKSKLIKEAEGTKERKRRKERFFYFPKEAPTVVKVIGGAYYVLLIISFVQFLYNLFVILRDQGGSILFSLLFGSIIYFLFAALIDAILKGKGWARSVNLVIIIVISLMQLYALSVIFSLSGTVNPIDVLTWLVYAVTAILLYLEPAKFWFKSKIEKEQQDELLDDF